MTKGNDNAASLTRESDASDYLTKHKIPNLLANLTGQLVFHRPEMPKEFIVNHLEKLRDARNASITAPSLFEDANLQSIFGMLDPSSRGFISHIQYIQALDTLGIVEYDKQPDGWNFDKIRMETLVREARRGLNKANATFSNK